MDGYPPVGHDSVRPMLNACPLAQCVGLSHAESLPNGCLFDGIHEVYAAKSWWKGKEISFLIPWAATSGQTWNESVASFKGWR